MSSASARLLRRVTRLDFLDGFGIALGRRSVSFARLVKRLATITLHEHRVVALPGVEQPVERRAALVAAVRSFRKDTGLQADRIFVSFPRSQTIISRLQLPASVKGDLEQVIDFEIERLLPLGRDEVYFDKLVRDVGDKVEVRLLSIPRTAAAEVLDALEEGGARVRSMVPTPIAVRDFLHFAPDIDDQSVVTLVDDGGEVEFDYIAGEDFLASHVLRPRDVASVAAVDGLVEREVAAVGGAAGEVQVFGLGMDPEKRHDVLAAEVRERGRALLGLAQEGLIAPEGFFETAPVQLVPALGAALAAVREGGTPVNLLPAEERRGVEEGAPLLTFFLVTLLVATFLIWITSAVVKDHTLLSSLQSELGALEPQVRVVHANADEVDLLMESLQVLTRDERRSNALLLQELTKVVPADAYLTTFRVKGGRVEIDGFAKSASDLVPLLEKSRFFSKAKFTSAVTKVGNNEERFSLTAEVAS